jgi:signal peptidase II
MKKAFIFIITVICIVVADFYSKYLAVRFLNEDQSIQIIGNCLKFTLVYNYGTTFGLFKNAALFITISIIKIILIAILIVLFLNISKVFGLLRHQIIAKYCIVLMIGGSLGNIMDRILDRKVTDFIDIGIFNCRWHIFNIADVFQSIGGFIILYLLIVNSKRMKKGNRSN